MTAKQLKSQLSVSFQMILVLILLSSSVLAQSKTSILRQRINQDLPSNNSKSITAAKLRSVLGASADAIDEIYKTISLADRLGVYNATTGIATISETGITKTLVAAPSDAKGKYYDVVVAGVNSVTGVSETWNIQDRIISAGTKWDRIPFAIGTDVIGRSQIQSSAVTADKTDMFQTGKNRFNVADPGNIPNKYINESTGAEVNSSSHHTSHFIPVTAGQEYKVSSAGTSKTARYIWYTSASANTYISGQIGPVSRTAPVGATFLRVSVNATEVPPSTLQVESGAVATAYEPYRKVLTSSTGIPIIANASLSATVSETANNLSPAARATVDQMSYLKGKNLFNIADTTNLSDRFINNTTGAISTLSGYRTTHFIKVGAGVTITMSSTQTGSLRVIYYDVNKDFISGVAGTQLTRTTPGNTEYIRLSVDGATTSWANMQVEIGASATSYEPFGYKIDKVSNIPISAKRADYALVSASTTSLDSSLRASAKQLSYSQTRNLFNIADTTNLSDRFISESTGLFSSLTGYKTTHFIKVSPGVNIYVSSPTFGGARLIYYNSSKGFIGGTGPGTAWPRVTPALTEYIRVSVNSATTNWEKLQIEISATATDYQPFGYVLDQIAGVKVFAKNSLPVNASTSLSTPVIAPIIYLPRQKELIVYNENVHQYFELEGKGKTRIELNGEPAGMKIRDRGMKFQQTSTTAPLTALPGTIRIYDKDYEVAKTVNFTVQPVDQTLNTAKTIINIGDSYTLRSTFVDAASSSAAASGLAFYGMRRSASNGATIQVNCEGRGGWLMSDYHTTRTDLFSPFRQPQDPYKYYGNTDYWKSAKAGPLIGEFPINYDWGNIQPGILALYNASTGLLNSPAVNDVMYVNAESAYKRWNGASWEAVTGLTFTFNFAKYRTLYGTPQVDIVHILLGTNDFSSTRASTFAATYSTFKSRMDDVITSFKADNPAGKFIVGIPPSSGRQGGQGVYETERRKIGYWLLAKALIADYGGREAEGILIADYHSTTDRVYGFPVEDELPFDGYSGSKRVDYTSDPVHASDGFKQMANIYFGVIQSLR
jgi:hypothetical protein